MPLKAGMRVFKKTEPFSTPLRPLVSVANGQREIVCGIIGDPDKRMLDGEKAEPIIRDIITNSNLSKR